MGITKGVEIYIRKVAPLGDPIEVTVRGYELSLRKAKRISTPFSLIPNTSGALSPIFTLLMFND